ncbi:MAG: hypothetical protein B7Z73_02880, partial [Planctomycetia bacterium 21-64-5]
MTPDVVPTLHRPRRVGRKTKACYFVAILAACLSVSFAAPPARGKHKPIDGTQYLPLALGRVMKYQVTVEPPVGKPRKATATNRVAERTVLNDKTYFKVTTTITGVPFIPDTLIYYRSTPDGVYQVLEGDEQSP